MCKQINYQQQQKMMQQINKVTATKNKEASFSSSSSVSSTSTTSTAPLSTPSSPISLGLDRSCPASVTSLPSRVVRLDHYQIGAIRNRCLEESSTTRDDDFEWYDLDAIDEHQEYSTTNKSAGLVFTTKQQLLRKQARANRFVDPSIMEKIDASDGPAFELDKFVISWISNIAGNNNDSNNNNNNNDSGSQASQTTRTDRELDDQIKSLEQELNMAASSSCYYNHGDDDSSSLGVSFSSL